MLQISPQRKLRFLWKRDVIQIFFGGLFLPCRVNAASDWLMQARHCVTSPRFWPIRSENSQAHLGREALRNSGLWLVRTLKCLDCIDQSEADLTRHGVSGTPEILHKIPLWNFRSLLPPNLKKIHEIPWNFWQRNFKMLGPHLKNTACARAGA